MNDFPIQWGNVLLGAVLLGVPLGIIIWRNRKKK